MKDEGIVISSVDYKESSKIVNLYTPNGKVSIIAKGALKVSDSIIAYGTFIYIAIHILINLLGILALMPLTGVPLPLLSYGGSFNINIIVLLFICQRIAIDTKKQKARDKIKKL